jgi:8-oxo-dGTP pyrophosphatase MutT (NUDIX family)
MQTCFYFNDKSIIITDSELMQINIPNKIYVCPNYFETEFSEISRIIFETETELIFIQATDFEKVKTDFINHFTIIEAAGGIVEHSANGILFIFRRGKWDLPKGKMELNESEELCAEREIEEETGATNLQQIGKLTDTFHFYEEKGKMILKISHWYHFKSNFEGKLIPQIEEEITAIQWVDVNDLNTPLANTFQAIKDVVDLFLKSKEP